MRKSFFAISPFCVALLLASYSSLTAEAAAIVSLMEQEDPELDFQAQTSATKKIKNPFVKLGKDLRSDGQDGAAKLMSDASDAMKNVLYKIPYMKEVLISGELAKLAFDYLVA